jgi:hypothetical protein
VWNDACIAHTQGYYGNYYDNKEWEVPAGSGMTLAKSLAQWWGSGGDGASSSSANFHVDVVSWPDNKPCAGGKEVVE